MYESYGIFPAQDEHRRSDPSLRAHDPGHASLPSPEDDRPLSPGTVGHIRMRGDTGVDGYFGDDAATSHAFRAGWFYPGDLGSVTEDGLLSITGRASEIINIGGNKVSPLVIEDALLAVPGVADAAAFGLPDALGIPAICAAIVTNATIPNGALEAACRGMGYAAPKRFFRVGQLPRNENGKILRHALVAMLLPYEADALTSAE